MSTDAPSVGTPAPTDEALLAEGLTKLGELRKHLATLATDQQAYYDRDGNMDNWATKMHLLQFNIGESIVRLESMSGRTIAETPDEIAWAESVREDRKRK